MIGNAASSLRIEQIIALVAARGVRVILVTHDVGQARRLADDVVFMSHGQVVEMGFADSFFSAPQSERARAFLDGRFVL